MKSKDDDDIFEKDDALDNILEDDGEDHFLYGKAQKPDHQPGPRSGCFGLIALLILPVSFLSWYLIR